MIEAILGPQNKHTEHLDSYQMQSSTFHSSAKTQSSTGLKPASPKLEFQRLSIPITSSFVNKQGRSEENAYDFPQIGLFYSESSIPIIRKGDTIFEESPILSSQLLLSKSLVQSCSECHRFLSVDKSGLADVVPPLALSHLEDHIPTASTSKHLVQMTNSSDGSKRVEMRRFNPLQFSLFEHDRRSYCSSQCFQKNYLRFLNLIDLQYRKDHREEIWRNLLNEVNQRFQDNLPSIPPQLILDAIAMEILFLNPKLNPYHERPVRQDDDSDDYDFDVTKEYENLTKRKTKSTSNSSHESQSNDFKLLKRTSVPYRTPKQKLKVLDFLKPCSIKFGELMDTFSIMATFANFLLSDYAPFDISPILIQDIVTRLYENQQNVVLKTGQQIDENGNITKIHQVPDIYTIISQISDPKVQAEFKRTETTIQSSGSGDLQLLFHPIVTAIFPTISVINHSCVPNAFISSRNNETCRASVIALTDIHPGTELTINYSSQASVQNHIQGNNNNASFENQSIESGSRSQVLKRDKRRQLLHQSFGFKCSCHLCLSGQ